MASLKQYVAVIKLVTIIPSWKWYWHTNSTTLSQKYPLLHNILMMSPLGRQMRMVMPSIYSTHYSWTPITNKPNTKKKKKEIERQVQTHINDDAICNLATTINNAFELVKSNQLVCFTRVLQDEYMNVKQYMYSIEQVVIVYEYLMLDDA